MRFDVLTLHPAMLAGPLGTSILGRAQEAGAFALGIRDLRDAATGRHRAVDDTPYGGGAGMVLRVDVVARAIASVRRPDSHVILTGPGGTRFDQAVARRFASLPHLVIVCGHYEGTDARVEDQVDEEVSLGDFVLTGGEIAACAIVDAVARLLPGALHNDASTSDESFGDGLLEYPQYTRPRAFGGFQVPEVLVGGHHGRIAAWRREAALARTRLRRPDLFARHAPAPAARARGRRRVDAPGDGD